MLYRPPKPRSMWGFWVIEWEGVVHIFYDEDVNADYELLSWQKTHDHIGHAVSKDLIHWELRPSLCVRGKRGEWNEMPSGGVKTGCITRYEDKFYMFAGAQQGGVQVVGLWLSYDLENWCQYPHNPVLKPAGPYYLSEPTSDRPSVSWRDPGIFYCKEDGHYHICISAMLKERRNDYVLGSVIGHIRSKDLIHWEYLPPFKTQGLLDRFYQIEEPEMFEIGGKYYLIFDGGTTGGMRVSTPYREDVRGVFYMMSSDIEGPYIAPDDDFLIGGGSGMRCATTGRIIQYNGQYLFLHLSIAKRPALSTPKILRARPDGTLYLEYAPILEKLETDVICESINALPASESPDSGVWSRKDGGLFCDVKVGGSVYRVAESVSNFHLFCKVRGLSAGRVGVVVRISEDGDAGVWPRGVGIILDFDSQKIFYGDATKYPTTGWYCKASDFCCVPLLRDRCYLLRCFVRGEHLEIYLDDCWVFTVIIPETNRNGTLDKHTRHYRWGPEAPKEGAIELMVERGQAIFSDLRLVSIEPLI